MRSGRIQFLFLQKGQTCSVLVWKRGGREERMEKEKETSILTPFSSLNLLNFIEQLEITQVTNN